jgi:hypothetical protein
MTASLKAPFPWFGGKSRASTLVWSRLGVVRNYVEPFAGSLAVLLGNPHPPATETVNDLDCYLSNFWRAIAAAPEEVAHWADWPVNEADLHARHQWLVDRVEFREQMKSDADFFDARIAGWWVWGISCWIGGGWCRLTGRRPERRRPHAPAGKTMGCFATGRSPDMHRSRGVHVHQQLPDCNAMCDKGANNTPNLTDWFHDLQGRLRRVRVICGDWSRVLTPTPLGLTNNVPPGFITGIVLDPPYDEDMRDKDCYAVDGHKISTAVRDWAIAHGDDQRLRIALCGYAGEHAMPASWECVPWKAGGGYGNQGANGSNAHKERIWFSPSCLRPERDELPLLGDTRSTQPHLLSV